MSKETEKAKLAAAKHRAELKAAANMRHESDKAEIAFMANSFKDFALKAMDSGFHKGLDPVEFFKGAFAAYIERLEGRGE